MINIDVFSLSHDKKQQQQKKKTMIDFLNVWLSLELPRTTCLMQRLWVKQRKQTNQTKPKKNKQKNKPNNNNNKKKTTTTKASSLKIIKIVAKILVEKCLTNVFEHK